MSNIVPIEVLEGLEILGQKYPWDEVQLWFKRAFDGKVEVVAYLPSNYELKSSCAFGHGPTIIEAIGALGSDKDSQNRDPEQLRRKAIQKLEEEIVKLRNLAGKFTLPPYIPNRELCENNPTLANYRPAATIDV